MEERRTTLTCIVCPVGCELEVLVRQRRAVSVRGNECLRGVAYAEEEMNPKRTLITVVRVKGGQLPVVSVKTLKPIPKELISKATAYLAKISRNAPVKSGDVIVENLLGLGARIVATRDCERNVDPPEGLQSSFNA